MRTKNITTQLVYSLILSVLLLAINSSNASPTLPPLTTPASGQQLSGKFVWFDLASIDLNQEKDFYASVFGWTFDTISQSEDQYTIIKNGENKVAGLFSVEQRKGSKLGALWIGLMSVENPNQTATLIQQRGGSVHTAPTNLAERGEFALFRDPEGALFGVLKSSSGDPPDNEVAIGDFLWMDLFSKDQKSAGDFYKTLVNYEVTTKDVGDGVERLLLSSFGRARAGIVPLPEGVGKAGWLPYVRVANIDKSVEKIVKAGGHIMIAPQAELLNGNLAIFSDPQGAVLGIVKRDSPETDKQ